MPKYYASQFLKFIGNALKGKMRSYSLACLRFSHHINGKFCHRNCHLNSGKIDCIIDMYGAIL